MWAHSANQRGQRHQLADHLRVTAELARKFAKPFGAGDLARTLGLLHDAGKARPEWQAGLLRAEQRHGPVGVPHKDLGARLGLPFGGAAAAMAILGHHGGLRDLSDVRAALGGGVHPSDQEANATLLAEVPELAEILSNPASLVPASWSDPAVAEMGLRLTFSALVDADHLDTGAHFAGLGAAVVTPAPDMPRLAASFESARAAVLAIRPASPIDEVRRDLYAAAVSAAKGPRGVYRLSAPTGSGKTLAAAGFALHHAAQHGMARVIVAVPYTTITEQNAAVYRSLLGDELVLEHHSNVEVQAPWQRTAAENWDAPFVVTTTVQLFDSLFGRMPSRSRKLHRLSNAVVVLDEVQALPHTLLLPILDSLRLLTEHFGTTVLMTSATQPSFQRLSSWSTLDGEIHEIVPDPQPMFDRLRRVDYEWRLAPRRSIAEVADDVAQHSQALVVMNTITDARAMFGQLRARIDSTVLHLSTRMCPAHRRAVLATASQLLANDEPVVVVSTQLIEAGVDIDFPIVFRALAPADSLQQAAGRANREGRRTGRGKVVVFDAEDTSAPAAYLTPVAQTLLHFGPDRADPDDLAALDHYYTDLYSALNLEHADRATTIQENRRKLNFQSVAEGPLRDVGVAGGPGGGRCDRLAFKMIDDGGTCSVVVNGYDGVPVDDLLSRLRAAEGPLRDTYRALQPFIVSLPPHVADRPDVSALLRPVVGDLMEWQGEYDPDLGINEGDDGVQSVW